MLISISRLAARRGLLPLMQLHMDLLNFLQLLSEFLCDELHLSFYPGGHSELVRSCLIGVVASGQEGG